MAEAAVEDPGMNRFFCHKCSVEIPRVLEDYTCPTCLGGFIEELDGPNTLSDENSDDHSDDDMDLDFLNDSLGQELVDLLQGFGASRNSQERDRERRVTRSRGNEVDNNIDEDQTTPQNRSGGRYRTTRNRLRLRNAGGQAPRGGDFVPLEHMIQDFIVNVTGVGWGPMGPGGRGNGPVFFLGNPGDYAWGREGLDSIVTQLLNQMDGAGPPPLDKDKIKEIPTVVITQEQVDTNLQCSVCWEDFKVGEDVRKLMCEHVYHEPCIIPWLELHGTCPICRKSLTNDFDENAQQNQESGGGGGGGGGGTTLPNLAAYWMAANNAASSRTSSTSSSSSSSNSATSTSSSSTNSRNRPPQSNDFHMELDFD